jgi:hypothetical protein
MQDQFRLHGLGNTGEDARFRLKLCQMQFLL